MPPHPGSAARWCSWPRPSKPKTDNPRATSRRSRYPNPIYGHHHRAQLGALHQRGFRHQEGPGRAEVEYDSSSAQGSLAASVGRDRGTERANRGGDERQSALRGRAGTGLEHGQPRARRRGRRQAGQPGGDQDDLRRRIPAHRCTGDCAGDRPGRRQSAQLLHAGRRGRRKGRRRDHPGLRRKRLLPLSVPGQGFVDTGNLGQGHSRLQAFGGVPAIHRLGRRCVQPGDAGAGGLGAGGVEGEPDPRARMERADLAIRHGGQWPVTWSWPSGAAAGLYAPPVVDALSVPPREPLADNYNLFALEAGPAAIRAWWRTSTR